MSARSSRRRSATRITAIPGVDRLDALEIDPEDAAAQYRERIVGPMRGTLPEKALKSIEEQLSGACTTEIAAFDEFTALLTDNASLTGTIMSSSIPRRPATPSGC